MWIWEENYVPSRNRISLKTVLIPSKDAWCTWRTVFTKVTTSTIAAEIILMIEDAVNTAGSNSIWVCEQNDVTHNCVYEGNVLSAAKNVMCMKDAPVDNRELDRVSCLLADRSQYGFTNRDPKFGEIRVLPGRWMLVPFEGAETHRLNCELHDS